MRIQVQILLPSKKYRNVVSGEALGMVPPTVDIFENNFIISSKLKKKLEKLLKKKKIHK